MWPFKKRKLFDGVPYDAQQQFIDTRPYSELMSLVMQGQIPSALIPKYVKATCGCETWYDQMRRQYQIYHTEFCKVEELRPPASCNCRNCGAPVWGSLCKYCGTRY